MTVLRTFAYFWIVIITLGSVIGCNQYPNKTLLCNGSAYNIDKTGGTGSGLIPDPQDLAVRIENRKISFSGSKLFYQTNVDVCKIGSSEFAKKDELFFETPLCPSRITSEQRLYGTYNYVTKRLEVSDDNPRMLLQGTYSCRDAT